MVVTLEDFPGTDTRRLEIENKFDVYLKLASRMLSSWLRRPHEDVHKDSQLDVRVRNLAILLDIQACRQFRSIVTLCQLGEAQNAEVVARSLFETVLATNFIFEPIAVLVESIKSQSSKQSSSPTRWRARVARDGEQPIALSQCTRAQIYLAHNIGQREACARRLSAEYFRATGRSLEPQLEAGTAELAYREIGPEWKEIHSKHPHTFSGLSAKDLSKACSGQFPYWYELVYRDQSRLVHSTDALACLVQNYEDHDCKPSWFSTEDDIWCALYCANLLFSWHIHLMNKNFDFGSATRREVAKLKGGVASLYYGWKSKSAD